MSLIQKWQFLKTFTLFLNIYTFSDLRLCMSVVLASDVVLLVFTASINSLF